MTYSQGRNAWCCASKAWIRAASPRYFNELLTHDTGRAPCHGRGRGRRSGAGFVWRGGTHANEPAHEIRYPLKEEESKSFQASGKLLSAAQEVRLAEQYQKDYDR